MKHTRFKISFIILLQCFTIGWVISADLYTNSNTLDITRDSIRPERPVVDIVSVDTATGYVNIFYVPSTSDDVARYILFKKINNQNIWVDSINVSNGMEHLFSYTASQPNLESESYAVAARDTADNLSGYSEYHSTMFLSGAYDSCNLSISLNWSPYIGWGDDLSEYQILTSVNDSTYRLLGTTADTLQEATIFHIKANQKYCYIIKALRNDGSYSFSNKICFTTNSQSLPENLNADFASVDDENILVSFTYTPGEFNRFALISENSNLAAPDTIEWFNLQSSTSGFTYTDAEANISLVNQYRIISYNPCGVAIKESNIATNIVLNASTTGNNSMLEWNNYQNWSGGIKEYEIYRLTSDGNEELIDKTSENNYADNLQGTDLSGISSEICYRIKAVEGDSNPYGIQGESTSNISCVTYVPQILVPNAFTPNNDGNNDVIKPVIDVIPEGYSFSVYDRFGNMVFQTTNYTEGWNGDTAFGKKAMAGVYLYLLSLNLADGTEVTQNGSITVFYP